MNSITTTTTIYKFLYSSGMTCLCHAYLDVFASFCFHALTIATTKTKQREREREGDEKFPREKDKNSKVSLFHIFHIHHIHIYHFISHIHQIYEWGIPKIICRHHCLGFDSAKHTLTSVLHTCFFFVAEERPIRYHESIH